MALEIRGLLQKQEDLEEVFNENKSGTNSGLPGSKDELPTGKTQKRENKQGRSSSIPPWYLHMENQGNWRGRLVVVECRILKPENSSSWEMTKMVQRELFTAPLDPDQWESEPSSS